MVGIKVKTPAKINLTLEILNKRPDGYHNIQSIMQAINLYDYLTFEIKEQKGLIIQLQGNNPNIPYDENNLVYKMANKFFELTKITNINLSVYIEKNIPVAAGLAGGSSDGAGTIYALNRLFNYPLSSEELDRICKIFGSDINFCLKGGCALCTSRGEILEPLPSYIQNVSLIKPKNIGISAKEAYFKYSLLRDKTNPNNSEKLKQLLKQNKFDEMLLYNSLEKAILPEYKELQYIKRTVKNSIMTGSGSTFFVLDKEINFDNNSNFEVIEGLRTISTGIEIISD